MTRASSRMKYRGSAAEASAGRDQRVEAEEMPVRGAKQAADRSAAPGRVPNVVGEARNNEPPKDSRMERRNR